MGSSAYYGDLAPMDNLVPSTINSLRWGFGIEFARNFSKKMSAALELNWIRLGADDFNANDLTAFARNLHFRNDVKEITVSGRYYPRSLIGNFTKRDQISPSLFLGLGYYWHNPQAKSTNDLGNEWVDLAPLNTEGQGLNPIYPEAYKLSGFVIPIGIGLKLKYNRNIDIGFDLSYRFIFTDYLDDVSGNYPNPLFYQNDALAKSMSNRLNELTDARTGANRLQKLKDLLVKNGTISDIPFNEISPLGSTGTPRGTDKGNDGYLTLFLKVRYLLGDGIKCPKNK